MVENEGFDFYELPFISRQYAPDLPLAIGQKNRFSRIVYRWKNRKRRRFTALKKAVPKEFIAFVKTEHPDLLIIDVELHEYIFAAYNQKIPFILLSQWYSLWDRPGLPYLLHDTIPGRGFWGSSFGIKVSWQLVKCRRWLIFNRQAILSFQADTRSILLALSNEYNFP
ncbi:MAG: hypothetical protein AAFY36_14910, partial [Bacteroidota bacterium]